mgnify:CR=1
MPLCYRSDNWADPTTPTGTYFYIYLAINVCCILFSFITGITFFQSMLMASKSLHSDLFRVISYIYIIAVTTCV